MKILGAGLAGLLAANILRKHNPVILEKQDSLPNNHTALLRHRELKISESTSIPFRKVKVVKAINYKGVQYHQPQISFSNMYSMKVTGGYYNRSIDNLAPVERYIAPPEFIEKLSMGCNIQYGVDGLNKIAGTTEPVISTLPMPVLWDKFLPNTVQPEFEYRKITTVVCYVDADCDVYQTVYYPNPNLLMYRMSITGNRVTAEFIGDVGDMIKTNDERYANMEELINHFLELDFGITKGVVDLTVKENKYGKIKEIPSHQRKNFLGHMTREYNIYSLGRYATWRNILLDDVHDDILIIQNMIANNGYYTGEKK